MDRKAIRLTGHLAPPEGGKTVPVLALVAGTVEAVRDERGRIMVPGRRAYRYGVVATIQADDGIVQEITAPVTGRVDAVFVEAGDRVERTSPLMTIEAGGTGHRAVGSGTRRGDELRSASDLVAVVEEIRRRDALDPGVAQLLDGKQTTARIPSRLSDAISAAADAAGIGKGRATALLLAIGYQDYRRHLSALDDSAALAPEQGEGG